MSLDKNRPDIEDWMELYEAAIEFKTASCWDWIYDDDFFGIQNPDTGDIAYCSIMGNAGQHFAIAGYIGSDGFTNLMKIKESEFNMYEIDEAFQQKCISCSFEDRDLIDKEDYKIIKELGLRFRGKNAWPSFRSFEPGYFPWYLNKEQVKFMTHIIRQGTNICIKSRDDEVVLGLRKDGTVFTYLSEVKDGEVIWRDEYTKPEFVEPKCTCVILHDEIFARKMKAMVKVPTFEVEATVFYSPSPVQDQKDSRPYYPKVCFFIERNTGAIVSFDMIKSLDEDGCKVIDNFTNTLKSMNKRPSKIYVSKNEVAEFVKDLCWKIDISLETVDSLYYADTIKREMFKYFEEGNMN